MTEQAEKPKLVEMVQYSVFNRVGIYVRGGTCEKALVEAQAVNDGETAREGGYEFKRSALRPTFRMKRKQAYPSVGDQLGAIADFIQAQADQGATVPETTRDWLDKLQAVKAEFPKDEN